MKAQILLVDDDPLVLESLSLSIKNEGYSVFTADNACKSDSIFNSNIVN